MSAESRFERVLEIARDILRLRDLDQALGSIARGVQDLFGFRFVAIAVADTPGGDLYRRVLLGWPDEIVASRLNERIPRDGILELLRPEFEVYENCFYMPAEREIEWSKAIYSGVTPIDAVRDDDDAWHERDAMCLILRDGDGEMIGYMSPDAPLDGRVPSREVLRVLHLYTNLMGLALTTAHSHLAEIERRRLLEANQARLRHEATHDALTGLPNRAYFRERLALALERAREHANRVYAVLFIDLDEFKSVNDSLGHLAGDAMLDTVAERMRETIGDQDFVARIGGDEFAVLLTDRSDLVAVQEAVESIQARLAAPMTIESRAVYNTASIGIAVIDPEYERIEDVLRNADTAMYHAKSLGRGRAAFFDHHMHYAATRRLSLTSDLRAALDAEQFSVAYQPLVRIEDGRITGFEALVRWRNPVTGEVLPGEFIPLAEDVGLVVAIGRYVFVDACKYLAEWRAAAPQLDLRMHVNLAVQEVLEPDADAFIARNLRRFGLSADAMTLEITETAIIRSSTLSIGSIAKLRTTGVRLCIDDFGTGYSSLRYLHQFPVDSLKIDRSFVESEDGSLGSPPIVSMLVQLARAYDIEVVAEGVETAEQAAALRELDCHYAQGYYFHRPMPPEAVTALLTSTATIAV